MNSRKRHCPISASPVSVASPYSTALTDLRSQAEPDEPPPETLALHKTLLTLFAQYDALTKRITGLPADEGSSQASVQAAVGRMAAGFLGREMGKVQVSIGFGLSLGPACGLGGTSIRTKVGRGREKSHEEDREGSWIGGVGSRLNGCVLIIQALPKLQKMRQSNGHYGDDPGRTAESRRRVKRQWSSTRYGWEKGKRHR
jgi:hypothetical protein